MVSSAMVRASVPEADAGDQPPVCPGLLMARFVANRCHTPKWANWTVTVFLNICNQTVCDHMGLPLVVYPFRANSEGRAKVLERAGALFRGNALTSASINENTEINRYKFLLILDLE